MRKITLYFFMLMVNMIAANAQTDNKAQSANELPAMFKELENGRPSPESLQQNPVYYYAAERRYDSLFTLLLQEVAAGKIPKSVLSVLRENGLPVKSYRTNEAINTENVEVGNFGLVKDINIQANTNPLNPTHNAYNQYAVLNNIIYFQAEDGVHGIELWRSDGTEEGTYMVKDIFKGKGSSYPNEIIVFKGKIFFEAYNEPTGSELYCSDGTSNGTYLIKDILEGNYGSFPERFCIMKGDLYFTTTSLSRNDAIWKTDGTEAGTILITNLGSLGASYACHLTAVKNLIFFVAYSSINKWEIWRTDGTANGTFMPKDITPGTLANMPSALTSFDNKLFFITNTESFKRDLWQSDGTPEGTIPVAFSEKIFFDYSSGYFFRNQPFFVNDTAMYVTGILSFEGGRLLYKIDPEISDTPILIKRIYSTVTIDEQLRMIENDSAFYILMGKGSSSELWKSSGTEETTVLVKEVYVPYSNAGIASDKKKVYFIGWGYEPWVSDGTELGTVELKDIYKGDPGSGPDLFTYCNGKIFFSATDLKNGKELWVSGGRESNTYLVKNINS